MLGSSSRRNNRIAMRSGEAEVAESACKPGSVENSHSSGMHVTVHLERPTRVQRGPRNGLLFGLAPGGVYLAATCYHARGALLPHHFTLTAPFARRGGLFSVALSVGSHPPGVTWHPALWSPDFPPQANTTNGDCPADSAVVMLTALLSRDPARIARQAERITFSNAARQKTAPRELTRYPSLIRRNPFVGASLITIILANLA